MAKVVGKLVVEISAEAVRPALIEAMDLTILDLERWYDIMYEAGHSIEAMKLEVEYLEPLRESKDSV